MPVNQPPPSVSISRKVPAMTPPGGAGSGVKFVALVAVPAGVVTVIGPAAAPAGTTAVICVGESTVNLALVPLNLTSVAPLKLLPLMITELPTTPLSGIEEMIGDCAPAAGTTFRVTGELANRFTVIQ